MPHFDSHSAFLADLSPTLPAGFDRPHRLSSDKGPEDFHGSGTWSDVRAAAPLGRSDLAARMRPLPPIHPLRPRRRAAYGVAGGAPSVPRHLAGNPISMRTTRKVLESPRTVRIAHCSYLGARATVDHAINRGIALLEIIDALEQNGTRVELVVYKVSDELGEGSVSITVKGPGDHYDLDLLAMILADSRWHRRLMFRSMEQHLPRSAKNGYSGWNPLPGAYDWLTPAMNPDRCETPAAARTWMNASAAELLGTIK